MDTTRPSLLLRIRDDADAGAWMLFDQIYRPILHRYARAWGVDFNDAEDVVQHTMSALHQQIDGFEYDVGRGRFRGWLRTIVNNRIRNLLRDHARERTQRDAAAADLSDQQADGALSHEEIFDRVWLQEHLWHCLRELELEVDEQTFRIYTRHVLDEVPAPTVAREFDVEPGNVYTIKWRLTKRIADRMRFLTDGDEA